MQVLRLNRQNLSVIVGCHWHIGIPNYVDTAICLWEREEKGKVAQCTRNSFIVCQAKLIPDDGAVCKNTMAGEKVYHVMFYFHLSIRIQ